jgi:hypothetical protein
MSLIPTVLGGIFFGAVIAGALRLLAGRSDDHLVDLTSTVLAAYGSSSRPGGQPLPPEFLHILLYGCPDRWGPVRLILQLGA